MLDTTKRLDAASELFADNAAQESKPCEQCGQPFEPRSGAGGSRQRFCSTECRHAFRTNDRQANPSAQPARPARSHVAGLPAVIPPAEKDAPADTPEDRCWSVQEQSRIECSATVDNEIEIEQLSPLHPDENVRIHVARSNAVRLARCILFATGFKSVLIATGDGGGGYSDVEDGDLPERFGESA
jgi:hypothetical protein